MTGAVVFFVLSGLLWFAGVVLRERDVPREGVIGRSHTAQVLSVALTASVIVAATLTFVRLIALSI
ncbi:hypothetical protein ABH922_001537 [Rhodococcus sp. 27YEA15]|uniref:hypothetical protein n=1 Tax=Rhodococcus sp. 27YEA15 TaxID=3156259 RepID=UPI003C7E9C68